MTVARISPVSVMIVLRQLRTDAPRSETESMNHAGWKVAGIAESDPRADDAPLEILVVGGGFAGLNAVTELAGIGARIWLVDRRNHHVFQPLLYQVATAALSPADIGYPIRRVFRREKDVHVVMDQLLSVDLVRKVALFPQGECNFDYLVLACGATHGYFGREDWAQYAPGLKTIEDALEIRSRVLLAFEEAEMEADPENRVADLTFVIVGGGPTGVEMAGALRQIATQALLNDFRNIDTTTARVILIQSADRLLPTMPEDLSERALLDLQQMGVDVRLKSRVTDIGDGFVMIGDEKVEAGCIFWAAGVKANPVAATLGVPLDKSGRIMVNPDLSLPGYPFAFAVGDIAAVNDPETGVQVPGVAQGAIQMGRFVGRLIRDEIQGRSKSESRPVFRYRDKGQMATIGRSRAVAQVGKWHFTGFFAWILWGLVHVLFLVGFRNRFAVLAQWIWDYVTFSKGARLITGNVRPQVRSHHGAYLVPTTITTTASAEASTAQEVILPADRTQS
jgi:NADH dehydrogenase